MAKPQPPIRRLSTMKELSEQASLRNSLELPVVELPSGQKLVYIEFSRIRPFAGHPFRLYTGERLDDMVDSIRRNGILLPPIVRRIHDDPEYPFEMLSGHNRMNAAALAGLEGAFCMVKDDMPQEEALMYVIETNLFQRSFRDLLPSEKAAVLMLRYSEMFSQGKRNDILRELELLEGDAVETSGNGFHKLSRDALAEEYELTGRSIANYVRIGKYLTEGLKTRLDNGELILRDALQLSHLRPGEQELLDHLLNGSEYRVDRRIAADLREYSEKGALNQEAANSILAGLAGKAANHSGSNCSNQRGVKIGYQVFSQYFAPTATRSEIEQTIEKALQFYFSSKREEAL